MNNDFYLPLPTQEENALHLTAQQFADGVRNGTYTHENGTGYFANENGRADLEIAINNYKTDKGMKIVSFASHIVWYWK